MTSFSLKATYADMYLFRGHVYAIDDSLIGDAGVGMGQWSYHMLYAKPKDSTFDTSLFTKEYTHEVSYTSIVGGKVITYGYHFYDYNQADPLADPNQTYLIGLPPDTQELFTRVAVNSPWNPTYGLAFDFDTYRGYYLDFSLTRFWSLTQSSKLAFTFLAAGSYQMIEKTKEGRSTEIIEPGFFEDDGVNHGSAHVKYSWEPQKWLKLETGLDYHYAFDHKLYDDVVIDRGNLVWRSSVTLTLP